MFSDGVPVTAKVCHVDGQRDQNTKKNHDSKDKRQNKIKTNPHTFDGSISMPVLITPDQSCFKNRNGSSNPLESSKSSTIAAESSQVRGYLVHVCFLTQIL